MAAINTNTEHETERTILNSLLADVTALRTAFVALTAKLDADAGVTDVNYAATCDPAALTTTEAEPE